MSKSDSVNKAVFLKKALSLSIIGCVVLSGSLYANASPTFERLNSRDARLGYLFTQPSDNGFKVNGYLSKSFNRRGRIPGHLHIDVLDETGKTIYTAIKKYHRHQAKANQSHFVENIAINQDHVSTIRVTHHGLSSERDCS